MRAFVAEYEELISRFGTSALSRRFASVGLCCQYGPRSASVGSLSRTKAHGSAGIDLPRPFPRCSLSPIPSRGLVATFNTKDYMSLDDGRLCEA